MDHLTIQPYGCFADVDVLMREIVTDVPTYVKNCSHVISDSPFNVRHEQIIPLFESVIYLVRDPRDSLVSWSTFAFKPYFRRYGWTSAQSSREFIESNLHAVMTDWQNHISGFRTVAEVHNILFIRYEDLLGSFDETISRVAKHLGCELAPKDLGKLRQDVSFENMKRTNPDHLQLGRASMFAAALTAREQDIAKTLAADGLEWLGYM
jgi:hypothetical protein